MSELVLVSATDWYGLYVDRRCVYQGTDIPDFVWLEHAQGCHSSYGMYLEGEKEDYYLSECAGYLPDNLDDLDLWSVLWDDYVKNSEG